ncbi:MAG: glucose-1-phosphate thymidylyltransferase [Acidimicrobiia bacterium]
MKGVVLAGGSGTRLRPITYSMAKQLVPVANKPILFYGLEDLADAGIKDVGMIIAPETGDEIRSTVGDGARFGLAITYIVQDRPLGLAHALKTALPFVAGDDVLMYLGDNLVKQGVAEIVADFERDRPNCQILLTEVDNPSEFGVVELGEGNKVVQLVEKPSRPPSNLALVGAYLFDATIAEAVDAISPSARGELEITDAIQHLVTTGRSVRPSIVRGWWKDTGKKEDLLHANALVLHDLHHEVAGEMVDSTSRGAIRVGAGSTLVDCAVTGPAVIGDGVRLSRVTVGPNTAIGDRCHISDASIEDTIILDGAEIHGWKLRNSLVGRSARLHGSAPEAFVEMTLGERSEVIGD